MFNIPQDSVLPFTPCGLLYDDEAEDFHQLLRQPRVQEMLGSQYHELVLVPSTSIQNTMWDLEVQHQTDEFQTAHTKYGTREPDDRVHIESRIHESRRTEIYQGSLKDILREARLNLLRNMQGMSSPQEYATSQTPAAVPPASTKGPPEVTTAKERQHSTDTFKFAKTPRPGHTAKPPAQVKISRKPKKAPVVPINFKRNSAVLHSQRMSMAERIYSILMEKEGALACHAVSEAAEYESELINQASSYQDYRTRAVSLFTRLRKEIPRKSTPRAAGNK